MWIMLDMTYAYPICVCGMCGHTAYYNDMEWMRLPTSEIELPSFEWILPSHETNEHGEAISSTFGVWHFAYGAAAAAYAYQYQGHVNLSLLLLFIIWFWHECVVRAPQNIIIIVRPRMWKQWNWLLIFIYKNVYEVQNYSILSPSLYSSPLPIVAPPSESICNGLRTNGEILCIPYATQQISVFKIWMRVRTHLIIMMNMRMCRCCTQDI